MQDLYLVKGREAISSNRAVFPHKDLEGPLWGLQERALLPLCLIRARVLEHLREIG
jgi:hypothetical protein